MDRHDRRGSLSEEGATGAWADPVLAGGIPGNSFDRDVIDPAVRHPEATGQGSDVHVPHDREASADPVIANHDPDLAGQGDARADVASLADSGRGATGAIGTGAGALGGAAIGAAVGGPVGAVIGGLVGAAGGAAAGAAAEGPYGDRDVVGSDADDTTTAPDVPPYDSAERPDDPGRL
jgi:hypothetical protein